MPRRETRAPNLAPREPVEQDARVVLARRRRLGRQRHREAGARAQRENLASHADDQRLTVRGPRARADVRVKQSVTQHRPG